MRERLESVLAKPTLETNLTVYECLGDLAPTDILIGTRTFELFVLCAIQSSALSRSSISSSHLNIDACHAQPPLAQGFAYAVEICNFRCGATCGTQLYEAIARQ